MSFPWRRGVVRQLWISASRTTSQPQTRRWRPSVTPCKPRSARGPRYQIHEAYGSCDRPSRIGPSLWGMAPVRKRAHSARRRRRRLASPFPLPPTRASPVFHGYYIGPPLPQFWGHPRRGSIVRLDFLNLRELHEHHWGSCDPADNCLHWGELHSHRRGHGDGLCLT